MRLHTCECGKACELFVPKSNEAASEWYCEECHRSYRCTPDGRLTEAA